MAGRHTQTKHCKKCRNAGVCIVYMELGDFQATDRIMEELARRCEEYRIKD